MDTPDLESALAFLGLPLIRPRGPCTASLLDESRPDGPVVLRNGSGSPCAVMPRDVWDDLVRHKI